MLAYYRMITGMDAVIGRVLAELETRGLAENTVVIYTADNGLFMGNRGFADKWLHYEESLRVPLIIHDPRSGKTKPGTVHPAMALNVDLPPTLLELAELKVPEKYQGRSLVPLLSGATPPDWREEFFCEHHSTNPRISEWLGIRGKRYTYARYVKQTPVFEMLHDLDKDPDQLTNLAADTGHSEILRQFRDRTDDYEKRYSRPEIIQLKAESVAKEKKPE
jgi:arylsulfatase A-like enzyme